MKFENIKPGDIVYVQVKVSIKWGYNQYFWLPRKVNRITPKQFIVSGKKYKKENGDCIGSYNEKASYLGDDHGNTTITDQTVEKNSLIKKINIACEIKHVVKELEIYYDHENLTEIYSIIKQLKKLTVKT